MHHNQCRLIMGSLSQQAQWGSKVVVDQWCHVGFKDCSREFGCSQSDQWIMRVVGTAVQSGLQRVGECIVLLDDGGKCMMISTAVVVVDWEYLVRVYLYMLVGIHSVLHMACNMECHQPCKTQH